MMARRRYSVRVMTALVALIIVNLLALCMQVYHHLPDVNVRVVEPLPSSSMVISARMQNQISSSSNEAEADALLLPSNSSSTSKSSYVRYDLLTTILERDNVRSVAHQLPSIPHRRRMIAGTDGVPADAVRNLTYFLESRLRPDEEDRPLYVYNPMLVPLNRKYIDDTILDDLGLLFDYEEYKRPPAYIAVYRVSNFGNCHGPGQGVPESYRNYLGLALLDRDLNIVRTMEDERYTDVVIDLNKQLFKANWTPRGKLVEKQFFQDCQLVVAPLPLSPVNAKADRLMLICNEFITHVRLERTGTFKWASRVHTDKSVKIRFENTYGSALQLTAVEMPNVIMRHGDNKHCEKNLHFFRQVVTCGGEDELGDGYLEIWPGGPHETRYIDFVNYNIISTTKSNVNEPVASFTTIDDVGISPLISRDSGSACCIPIRWHDDNDEDGEGRRLLLGFSHRKTRKGLAKAGSPQFNYVSRVYAFEPIPPFDIVARSGFFCLGFELGLQSNGDYQEKSEDMTNEQVIGAANDYRLKINGEVFDKCPSIHFVTGIADKLDEEEETAIISYGVNDCYPRMIEVPKKVLVSLLKGSPEV